MYIVFEGTVGTGKTTQSKLLLTTLQKLYPDKKIIRTREPGGSEIADDIRKIVQATPYVEDMNPICEAYLYASSRAQTLRSIVGPVLEEGGIVISDRSFCSSIAYQGVGLGVGFKTIMDINRIAISKFIPNIVIYIDLDPAIGMSRTFDIAGDKHESKGLDFFVQVRKGYQRISQQDIFDKKWYTIDGNQTIEQVQHMIQKLILPIV